MIDWIKSTRGLIITGIAMMLTGAGFLLWGPSAGAPPLLDMIRTGDEAAAHIAGLSAAERNSHFWMTVLLDTAYPLTYGPFLAGLALRFFRGAGKWLCLPAFATIFVDLAENTAQAMALKGFDTIGLKDVLTPLKFGLFQVAGVIGLAALVWGLISLIRRRRA